MHPRSCDFEHPGDAVDYRRAPWGGGDLHSVKETLRHSTIKLASDTYTSLLAEVDQEIS